MKCELLNRSYSVRCSFVTEWKRRARHLFSQSDGRVRVEHMSANQPQQCKNYKRYFQRGACYCLEMPIYETRSHALSTVMHVLRRMGLSAAQWFLFLAEIAY